MQSISHKAKQLLVLLIKLLIVGCAFYFIYDQLAHNDQLNWVLFLEKFNKNKSVLGIAFLLLLSLMNRFLEILKWQNLVSFIKKISLFDATNQVLSALTAGLLPQMVLVNMLEKPYFLKKTKRRTLFF